MIFNIDLLKANHLSSESENHIVLKECFLESENKFEIDSVCIEIVLRMVGNKKSFVLKRSIPLSLFNYKEKKGIVKVSLNKKCKFFKTYKGNFNYDEVNLWEISFNLRACDVNLKHAELVLELIEQNEQNKPSYKVLADRTLSVY